MCYQCEPTPYDKYELEMFGICEPPKTFTITGDEYLAAHEDRYDECITELKDLQIGDTVVISPSSFMRRLK